MSLIHGRVLIKIFMEDLILGAIGMAIEDLLSRLRVATGVEPKVSGAGQWRGKCPCSHNDGGQLAIKELNDGRILIHCHAGHSPTEIMEALDMSLSDLFEKPLDSHIQPLYMVRQENRRLATIHDKIKDCQLRLDMAKEMRERGIKLTNNDMQVERQAFLTMRQLQAGIQQ